MLDFVTSFREGDRHSDSLSIIQLSKASPSEGIRPFPVKQSTTTCETDAYSPDLLSLCGPTQLDRMVPKG